MGEKSLGTFIAFTAMGLVSVEAKPVIEAFGLYAGFLDKLFTQCLKRLEFATLNFEIGHDRTAIILGCHRILLSLDYTSSSCRELSKVGFTAAAHSCLITPSVYSMAVISNSTK
jgi:UDP-galactopyranose mutase